MARGEVEVKLYYVFNLGVRWGVLGIVPAVLPPGKTRYPLYWRLGGPQGRSGWLWKMSPLPGFNPRTVQPVASRYTDYAIPAHTMVLYRG